jgi:DNA-binding GntR family transcriptional regulator
MHSYFSAIHRFAVLRTRETECGQAVLYHVFENVYHRKLHWAEEVIGAVTASDEQARLLQTSLRSGLLLIKETTYDAQLVPIEYSISLLWGDRYIASVSSVRK